MRATIGGLLRRRRFLGLVGTAGASTLLSCGGEGTDSFALTNGYRMPEQLGDGWVISTLDAEGMDTQLIEGLDGEIDRGTFRGIYAMVIVRNGALVHEAYFQGHDRDTLETTYSITKSVTSSLIGIAIN
jgi:CubicO group peptidase (beta-lactamase class C family)